VPVITSIKSQKNKKRVNIYLDEKFGFGLDLENFVKLGLKVEQFLSEEEVVEIIQKAEFQKIYDKLVRFATLRPRSVREVNTWMVKHQAPDSIRNELFDKLYKLELVGDEKFARWWIEQRLQFKNKSKRELIAELRVKGIEKNIIEDVLEELPVNETHSAKKLLEKNEYRWEKFDTPTAKRKKSEYLARKGFGWDVIKKLI
jgi:regulatory protein